MGTQFEKRKAKSSADLVKEVEIKLEEIKKAPAFTQKGMDVFTPDGGAHFFVAELAYNPETMKAEVTEIFNISRMVGLSYQNQKNALGTLKKRK